MSVDPVSMVIGVANAAITIAKWIDAQQTKEMMVQDVGKRLLRITALLRVDPIQNPLRSTLPAHYLQDVAVSSCIADIGVILDRVREHLDQWSSSKRVCAISQERPLLVLMLLRQKRDILVNFIMPGQVIEQLRQDDALLNSGIIDLSAACLTLSVIENNPFIKPPPPVYPLPSYVANVSNADVKKFWIERERQ